MVCLRPCILNDSISCSQNPISPEDVIERTGFFYKSPNVQSTAVDKTSFHGFFLLSSTISELGNTADWKRSLLPDPPEMYETV